MRRYALLCLRRPTFCTLIQRLRSWSVMMMMMMMMMIMMMMIIIIIMMMMMIIIIIINYYYFYYYYYYYCCCCCCCCCGCCCCCCCYCYCYYYYYYYYYYYSHSKAQFEIFYNLLTAPRTVCNTYSQVAPGTSSVNHVQHIERLSRATCRVTCQLVRRESACINLTGFKSHLFELSCIGWTINWRRRGGTGVPGENLWRRASEDEDEDRGAPVWL